MIRLSTTLAVVLTAGVLIPSSSAAQSPVQPTFFTGVGQASSMSLLGEGTDERFGQRVLPADPRLAPVIAPWDQEPRAASPPSFWRQVLLPTAIVGIAGFGIGHWMVESQDCVPIAPPPRDCLTNDGGPKGFLIGASLGAVVGGVVYLWNRAAQ